MLRSITDYVMNLSGFLLLFTICGAAPGDDCPVLVNEITVMANFDASRMVGTWYATHSYNQNEILPEFGKQEYYLNVDDGSTLVQVTAMFWQGQCVDLNSMITSDATTPAKMRLDLDVGEIIANVSLLLPVWMLATDYDSYALAYSCLDAGQLGTCDHEVTLILWQKCPYTLVTLPDATQAQLRTLLDDICIDDALLTRVETDYECFENHCEEEGTAGAVVASSLLMCVVALGRLLL